LALDSEGNPHIAYYDATVPDNGDLMYATKSNDVWTIETVDSPGDPGKHTSLALDSNGIPHISYYGDTNNDLKYANRLGGTWSYEVVESSPPGEELGLHTSLALDDQDIPHIAYYDAMTDAMFTGRLKYVNKAGGVWGTPTIVDDSRDAGRNASLALDAQGEPYIAYYYLYGVGFASKDAAGGWTYETVDTGGVTGRYTSLAVDSEGRPHISYQEGINLTYNLMYARKSEGVWTLERLDTTGNTGGHTSIALDAQDNPRISYADATSDVLMYTDSAVHVLTPSGGQNWIVGDLETIEWKGTGKVDIYLSVDGGRTFDMLFPGITRNAVTLRVPHAPTLYAIIRIHREDPLSTSNSYDVGGVGDSESESRFLTIDATIKVLSFDAEIKGDGVALSWETQPGPEAEIRYRLERTPHDGAAFSPVHSGLLSQREYIDHPDQVPGRYRLIGVNGLGEEYVLREIRVEPMAPLSVWPLPYKGGQLHVSFVVNGRIGDVGGDADVALFDCAGQRVATLAKGRFAGTRHFVTWDGRDDSGRPVCSGIYFVRSRSLGHDESCRIVALR
jgi:hypothetical protein